MTRERRRVALALVAGISLLACRGPHAKGHLGPDSVSRGTSRTSAHPLAVDVGRVGTYPALASSGAGYFYDDVLEYRVWVHHAAGGDDTYSTFAQWEAAAEYSKATAGAEEPLVLVRQREWLDEPSPGRFVPMREERITEWRVEWLAGSKRQPGSIDQFLRERGAAQQADAADEAQGGTRTAN